MSSANEIVTVTIDDDMESAVAFLDDDFEECEVHLDCGHLAWVRSDDLSQLISLRLRLQRREKTLVLTNVNEEVMKTLELTRLHRLFEITETVA